MSQPIEDADFTIRTYAVLKRNGINTVDEIKQMDKPKKHSSQVSRGDRSEVNYRVSMNTV